MGVHLGHAQQTNKQLLCFTGYEQMSLLVHLHWYQTLVVRKCGIPSIPNLPFTSIAEGEIIISGWLNPHYHPPISLHLELGPRW